MRTAFYKVHGIAGLIRAEIADNAGHDESVSGFSAVTGLSVYKEGAFWSRENLKIVTKADAAQP